MKARYSQGPIRSVDLLAKALAMTPSELRWLADHADDLYRPSPQTKKDGTQRMTWDALPKLKVVHGKIKSRLLDAVSFPRYLFGGIRDPHWPRDYARNASLHTRQKTLITEDVRDYFSSITIERVEKIWKEFFRFSSDVASVLARLTTRKGVLPQGARTSNHLANLALFDVEPDVVRRLRQLGIIYTRLTDDISMSSRRSLSPMEKARAILIVYRMMEAGGCAPKRRKQRIMHSGQSMIVTGLVANVRVSLPRSERAAIRAQCHNYPRDRSDGTADRVDPHVAGRLGKLRRFHSRGAERAAAQLVRQWNAGKVADVSWQRMNS